MSSKQIATELLRRRLATESLIASTEYTLRRITGRLLNSSSPTNRQESD